MDTKNDLIIYSVELQRRKTPVGFFRMRSGPVKDSVWLFLNEFDALHFGGSTIHTFCQKCHFEPSGWEETRMWEHLSVSHIKLY